MHKLTHIANLTFVCSQFQISATDVDFWKIDAKELELMHKEGMHPPRFTIHVYATQFASIPIFFQGAEEDIKIELQLKPASSGIMLKLQYNYVEILLTVDTIHFCILYSVPCWI